MISESDGELYRKYGDELIRFATALVGPSGAEDVLATALIRCFSSRHWPAVTNRRAYLYRVVTNEAFKVRRSTQRRLSREARVAVVDAYTDGPEDVDVLRALRRLTPRQRAVGHLTYWQDLPAHEVADLLGLSVRTVERELNATRRRLEELLS